MKYDSGWLEQFKSVRSQTSTVKVAADCSLGPFRVGGSYEL